MQSVLLLVAIGRSWLGLLLRRLVCCFVVVRGLVCCFVVWFVASSLGLLHVAIGRSSLGASVLLSQAAGGLPGHSGLREEKLFLKI
jgi:hypothetical protein